jgi:cytochrome P450 family 3 subfamily A
VVSRVTGKPLRPVEYIAQSWFLLLAGYETTATALTFAVYLLACNPVKEATLLEEIDRRGRDTAPTYESLDQWPYATVSHFSTNCVV